MYYRMTSSHKCESMGKPCSCACFMKSRILNYNSRKNPYQYYKPGETLYPTTSHMRCIWTCNEIEGLYDKIITIPSYTGKNICCCWHCYSYCALITIQMATKSWYSLYHSLVKEHQLTKEHPCTPYFWPNFIGSKFTWISTHLGASFARSLRSAASNTMHIWGEKLCNTSLKVTTSHWEHGVARGTHHISYVHLCKVGMVPFRVLYAIRTWLWSR